MDAAVDIIPGIFTHSGFHRIVGNVVECIDPLQECPDDFTFKPVIPDMAFKTHHFVKPDGKDRQDPLHHGGEAGSVHWFYKNMNVVTHYRVISYFEVIALPGFIHNAAEEFFYLVRIKNEFSSVGLGCHMIGNTLSG